MNLKHKHHEEKYTKMHHNPTALFAKLLSSLCLSSLLEQGNHGGGENL